MKLSSLTITITNPRVIDGFVATLHSQNEGSATPITIEQFVLEQVNAVGRGMADAQKIGMPTSAAFVRRFTSQEYVAILTAAEQNQQVMGLVTELINEPFVALDDPRLLPGLTLLVGAGLLEPDRPQEILSYERP